MSTIYLFFKYSPAKIAIFLKDGLIFKTSVGFFSVFKTKFSSQVTEEILETQRDSMRISYPHVTKLTETVLSLK